MLLGRYMHTHSGGSAEGVGRAVAGQSFASPSRYTWTSARFATWLPESLVPRAGHRRDRTFYLICLSGFKHFPSTALLIVVSLFLHQQPWQSTEEAEN